MKIVTAETMRELDRRAMAEGGMSGVILMESAGIAVLETLLHRYGPLTGAPVHVACGTGNNGGDGFVVARLLYAAGAEISYSICGDPSKISGDALHNLDLLKQLQVCATELDGKKSQIKVDALLGTGLSGPPRDKMALAIEMLNATPGPTIAVDIPSGVNSDTGVAEGAAIRADLTVTFGYPKLGHFLRDGAELTGELVVDPIRFDWESLGTVSPYEWLRSAEMRSLIPPRPRFAHKGTFGHVLVIGGSIGMSGAPSIAARAAARAGSGLVTAGVPKSIQPVVAASMPELMTLPLSDQDGALTEESAPAVLQFAKTCDAVCLGPGLRLASSTRAFVVELLRSLDKPLVLDADGLNSIAGEPERVASRSSATVLTPHPGECARLLGTTVAEVEEDRVSAARRLARASRSVVVLKGAYTMICDGRGNEQAPICINTTGNAGMATGGSGDALTGVIGSFVGQGLDSWDAARLGVFIHAAAGDRAAEVRGTRGLIASDITEMVPAALRELEES